GSGDLSEIESGGRCGQILNTEDRVDDVDDGGGAAVEGRAAGVERGGAGGRRTAFGGTVGQGRGAGAGVVGGSHGDGAEEQSGGGGGAGGGENLARDHGEASFVRSGYNDIITMPTATLRNRDRQIHS